MVAPSQSMMNSRILLVFTVTALLCLASVKGAAKGPVIINELMYSNVKETNFKDDRGETADWIELKNTGAVDVPLSGWKMTDSTNVSQATWTFPNGAVVPANGFLVIFASGEDRYDNATKTMHTNFRLKRNGEQVILINDKNEVVSNAGGSNLVKIPNQHPGVSWGIPQGAEATQTATYLATPTPGAENSEAAQKGPFAMSATKNPHPRPQPASGVPVFFAPQANLDKVQEVKLTYRVNFGGEQVMSMSPATVAPDQPYGKNVLNYSATIPTTTLKGGEMVRWFIQATDTSGRTTRYPDATDPKGPKYFGTVLEDDANSTIPILYWFTENPEAAISDEGFSGCIYFDGKFYDNIMTRRRGVSNRSWKKPKLKMRLEGQTFRYSKNRKVPEVEEFNLQSFFYEFGENSYMKEVVATTVMKEQGVIAPESFHVLLQQNNQYYGLFAFVENVDNEFLEKHDLDRDGPLFKSESGEYSNLRWDTKGGVQEMKAYWGKGNRRNQTKDWDVLQNFTVGLAGGGELPRSKYLLERLNLPQVINEAAVQTLLNNMDRCTKNFFMYWDPRANEWYRLPWDLEASLGQDNGLGGKPGPYYCMLHCEQWNSPLYCDSEHTQDMEKDTPYGKVAVRVDQLPQRSNIGGGVQGRKLAQIEVPPIPNYYPPKTPPTTPPMKFPQPAGWDNPDKDMSKGASKNGVPGTYNHLTDAILDVNVTRAMYMRRLRTLADEYYANGGLRKIVDELYLKIREYARKDEQLWGTGNVDRGYVQITKEFIPMRTEQLLTIYAVGGQMPLLPAAQPNTTRVKIGRTDPGSTPRQAFIELVNQENFAVDLSGWRIHVGTDLRRKIPEGTVIPPNGNLFLVTSVNGFRNRPTSPRGGEGLIAIDVGRTLNSKSPGVSLTDKGGKTVDQSTANMSS